MQVFLPQSFNKLTGETALKGPRPLALQPKALLITDLKLVNNLKKLAWGPGRVTPVLPF
jgi:lipopolysaccharide/colanic/teichoic acid biosynthesis glycosyltransferase